VCKAIASDAGVAYTEDRDAHPPLVRRPPWDC
jgi:hypothetical protein